MNQLLQAYHAYIDEPAAVKNLVTTMVLADLRSQHIGAAVSRKAGVVINTSELINTEEYMGVC
jgi:hypothetical protein